MTQKEECLCYCIDHLKNRSLSYILNISVFNAYYEQNNYPCSNAYNVGVNAADAMILAYQPTEKEVSHER